VSYCVNSECSNDSVVVFLYSSCWHSSVDFTEWC